MKGGETMLSFLDEMDSFERNIFVIEKTCSLELSQLFQNYRVTIYTEANDSKKEQMSSGKRTGGLIGVITSALASISKMLGALIEEIVSIFAGKKKVDDNTEVKFPQNPAKKIQAIDQTIREDIDMVDKLKNGEANMDDAKVLLGKHSGALDEIEPYVGPIKAIAADKFMSMSIVQKWKREIDRACHMNGEELSASARELARSSHPENKNEVIDQAVEMILNDIQKNSSEGSNIIMDFGRRLYVKKEVTDRLNREANDMSTISGGIAYRSKLRAARREMNREANRTRKATERIDKNREKNAKARAKNAQAAENLSRAKSERWNDVSAQTYTKRTLKNKVSEANKKASSIDTDEAIKRAKEARNKNPLRDKLKTAGDKGSLTRDTDVENV